jgi:hypothetical protein
MNRAEVLDKAKAAVTDREGKYGHPRDNFERIARRWQTHLVNRYGADEIARPDGTPVMLDADDVAAMLVDVKLARAESGVYHPDNFIDVAGYAALAAEIGAPPRQVQPSADMLKGMVTDYDRDLHEWKQCAERRCTCGARIAKDSHKPGCPLGEHRKARKSGCTCPGGASSNDLAADCPRHGNLHELVYGGLAK